MRRVRIRQLFATEWAVTLELEDDEPIPEGTCKPGVVYEFEEQIIVPADPFNDGTPWRRSSSGRVGQPAPFLRPAVDAVCIPEMGEDPDDHTKHGHVRGE